MMFGCLFYLIAGLCGYLTYGDNVKNNILQNFPTGKWYVTVAQLSIVLLVTLSYPLQVHPARISTFKIIFGIKQAYKTYQNKRH
eukprot:Pgem_evm1s10375